jgi:hypothetical protein
MFTTTGYISTAMMHEIHFFCPDLNSIPEYSSGQPHPHKKTGSKTLPAYIY